MSAFSRRGGYHTIATPCLAIFAACYNCPSHAYVGPSPDDGVLPGRPARRDRAGAAQPLHSATLQGPAHHAGAMAHPWNMRINHLRRLAGRERADSANGAHCYWAASLLCLLKLLDMAADQLTRISLAVGGDRGCERIGGWRRMPSRPRRIHHRTSLHDGGGGDVPARCRRPHGPGRYRSGQQANRIRIAGRPALGRPLAPGNVGAQWRFPALGPPDRHYLSRAPCRAGCISMLCEQLQEAGFNLLSFDFRGHGYSQGHVVSFGDIERYDVLGAVRWLREHEAPDAQRIVGIGVETGSAALLGAAADPGPDGQAIASLVVCGGFNRFDALTASAGSAYFIPPLQWLDEHIGLPMACLQTGVNLSAFAPAVDAQAWRRGRSCSCTAGAIRSSRSSWGRNSTMPQPTQDAPLVAADHRRWIGRPAGNHRHHPVSEQRRSDALRNGTSDKHFRSVISKRHGHFSGHVFG